MNFSRLEYIKNVNHIHGWAYSEFPVNSYFKLNFKDSKGVDTHVLNLPKGALIILSQKPPFSENRYLTHVVELVNSGAEDKQQWEQKDDWGLIRWVKVCWVADFQKIHKIPLDHDTMKAEWGKENTMAKSLQGDNLMKEWESIDALRQHLSTVFK